MTIDIGKNLISCGSTYVALFDPDSMKLQDWLGPFHMDWRTTMHAHGLLTIFQECLHVSFLENCQKTICMHDYSLIHVDRSLTVSNLGDTASYRIWLLRLFFCQLQLFVTNYSSKFKDRLPSEKKTVLTRSTLGRSLQTFCPQASCVSFWWCLSKNYVGTVYNFFFSNLTLEKLFFRGLKTKQWPKI